MKRTSEWAVALSFSFLVTALIAFYHGYFVDATFLGLYSASGLFFVLSPHRTKNARWNSFKVISYLMFICGLAVSMFKYIFLQGSPV
jgi:hypothetical protein